MLSIFNLEYYKYYLNSFYGDSCEYVFDDEYLLEIINNTKEFILDLLERVIFDGFSSFEFPIVEDYIFDNYNGSYYPDTFIPVDSLDEGKIISKYLLDMFLGKNSLTYIDDGKSEVLDDRDELVIGRIYEIPKLVIVADYNLLREKYELLKQDQNERLVRILKQEK